MSTKVDFHIRNESGSEAREFFLCRLSEKVWRKGHRILILAPDRRAAARIDDRLWTFKEDSFVPHEMLADEGPTLEPSPSTPILIGTAGQWKDDIDVLVTLALEVPEEAACAKRVVEIVAADESAREAGRRRFREYRRRGFILEIHR